MALAPKIQAGSFAQLPTAGKAFLLILCLALLTAAYYGLVHMGLEEETEAEMHRYDTLGAQLNEAHQRQKEYLKLREEASAREALDKQNLRILPVTAEIPAFLDDLNRLAELSGLEMDRVTPSLESTEQFYIKVPVLLQVRGRYHEFAKFFYNISRLERAINMEDIKLSTVAASTRTDGEVQLAVNVRATTFRRKDKE
jgi:type IV pilus assembly protein PilO